MMSAPPPTPPGRHHILHHHPHHHPSHHISSPSNSTSNPSSSSNLACSTSQGSATTSPSSVDTLEDKHSLKMKIKRTKPPTKTSEAKHEIVKPSESSAEVIHDGSTANQLSNSSSQGASANSNSTVSQTCPNGQQASQGGAPQQATNGTSNCTPVTSRQNVLRHSHKKDKRRQDVNGSINCSTPLQQHMQLQSQQLHQHNISNSVVTPGKNSSASQLQQTPLRGDTIQPPKRLKIVSKCLPVWYAGTNSLYVTPFCYAFITVNGYLLEKLVHRLSFLSI